MCVLRLNDRAVASLCLEGLSGSNMRAVEDERPAGGVCCGIQALFGVSVGLTIPSWKRPPPGLGIGSLLVKNKAAKICTGLCVVFHSPEMCRCWAIHASPKLL